MRVQCVTSTLFALRDIQRSNTIIELRSMGTFAILLVCSRNGDYEAAWGEHGKGGFTQRSRVPS